MIAVQHAERSGDVVADKDERPPNPVAEDRVLDG